jgi:alkylation response protein AidB-like acyl-CoA dehydrogenase
MDFALTDIQRHIAAAARRYLDDRYPPGRVAALADAGDRDVRAWPELVRQGWLDAELGPVELALIAEQCGRALHPVPWLTTMALAAPILRAAGEPLPGPVAFADGTGGCRADRDGTGWRVNGLVRDVVDVADAVDVIVVAPVPSGLAVFGVRPDDAGVLVRRGDGIDPLRGCGDVVLSGAAARPIPVPEPVGCVLAAARRNATVLLAAEAVGVAQRALDLAVAYARARRQFGRPIGSFQAVAHPLAEGHADVELARSLAYRAAATMSGPSNVDLSEPVACAGHACVDAAVRVTELAMQVHGGVGVTWELPLHRWYRRALWLEEFQARAASPLDTVAEALFAVAQPEGSRRGA